MAVYKDIAIYSEKPGLAEELIAGAHTLITYTGGQVIAIVVGTELDAAKAVIDGADQAYWLENEPSSLMVEDYVPTIEKFLKDQKPFGLLIGATRRGKAVAGRLAARLGASVITDARDFVPSGKGLQLSHLVLGGSAIRFETHTSEIMLATVGMGVFQSLTPDASRKGAIAKLDFVEPSWKIDRQERKTKPSSSINLATAKKVVCPGNGLATEKDLALIHDLAEALGAEMGCTRKLYERLNCLSSERQVGISGAYIKPDLYIGIGLSGQVQHTVGITDSKIIVAINKDRNAPIFTQADYGIVGDLYEIIPVFLKYLQEKEKSEGVRVMDSDKE